MAKAHIPCIIYHFIRCFKAATMVKLTNILTAWQTPVSVQVLIRWLQVQFKQAVGPGVLQTFEDLCCKALINKLPNLIQILLQNN